MYRVVNIPNSQWLAWLMLTSLATEQTAIPQLVLLPPLQPKGREDGQLGQSSDILWCRHHCRAEPPPDPPDGVPQLLVPQTVDDWVKERRQSRVQHRDNDANLEKQEVVQQTERTEFLFTVSHLPLQIHIHLSHEL